MSLSPPARPGSSADPLERLLAPPGRGRTVAGVAVAVAGPVLATALASIPSHRGTAVPALLFLLTVVAAAAVGHLWPALLAAAVSFVGLDYFFTDPIHTFAVSKGEDLFALAVFLVVAASVSAAISAALEQRSRAEFREQQVRALYHVTSRLLSADGLGTVLQDLASSLRFLYDLAGCRVVVVNPDGSERERATSGTVEGTEVVSLPLMAEGRPVGRIEMSAPRSGRLAGPEAEVLNTFAAQLALALERARLGEEAAEARVEAEASRVRAALFSSVTHDLRTPLASIKASASSLLERGVPFSDEQRTELLQTILEESERLNRLVANLMDLSRLRAGALAPAKEPVLLEDLIGSVVRRLQPVLVGREVRVLVREDVPPVPVDVVQMDQVLTNVIENAVRYSPPATEIAISALRWHNMVEVRVSDRGPGIPREERGRVLEEFYRRDVDGRRSGTGLGLAIARAVAVAHGGSIGIEETPGGGTTVVLRLPLAPAEVVPAGTEPRN
jgi:two-component system sensor histidine kinase KdpD